MTYLIPTYFKEEDINGPKKLKEILSRKSYPTEDKTDKTKLSKECKILFLCALKLA
jgi:hypothetical protein